MRGDETDSEVELRDYLQTLGQHRFLIAVTVALIVGAAMLASYLQTPVYAATARVLIQPRPGVSPFEVTPGQRTDTAQFAATEIEVIKGQPVQEEVRRRVGSAPPVAVRPVGSTAVVQVVAESTDPMKAAAIANAYVESYIANRRQQGVDESLSTQKEVQGQIDVLQTQIDGLDGQIASVQGSVADSLRAQRQALVQQQALFKQTLDQQQVNMALITGGAQVVRGASVPTSPVRPAPLRNGILALIVGLMLGVGLAFFVEHLDDSVKTSDDIERLPGGPPVIGRVPVVTGWRSKDEPLIVSVTDPRSVASEAYRTLRTAVQFIALEHPMKTLQITSASAGEGKTTTLANLGVAMSATGLRVIILCCDLRRPRIHEFFGLDNEIGFTSVLLGKKSLSAAIQAVPGNDHLFLLASGPVPPNPSELLSSNRTAEVLASLQASADIVLIDCPPVLPVTDALVLSGRVDATLMVSVAGATTRKEAARTVESLRRVEAPLIGAVLNGSDGTGRYGYGYRYGRYDKNTKYTPEEAGRDKWPRLGRRSKDDRSARSDQPVRASTKEPKPKEPKQKEPEQSRAKQTAAKHGPPERSKS